MKRIYQIFICLLVFPYLHACSSSGEQVSGIIAEAQFETIACQPKSKLIKIRNEDTAHPQRIYGIHFEMGTNPNNYFKIEKASSGGVDFTAEANVITEVIIPAGGVLDVLTTYNPRAVTPAGQPHTAYMDIFLNGPKLGTLQVRLSGKAETAAPGCTAGGGGSGTPVTFSVDKITVTIKDANAEGGQIVQEKTNVGTLTFNDDGGTATLTPEGFPNFDIETPDTTVGADLVETVTGTWDGSNLTFENASLAAAGGVITVSGVKITTGQSSATNTDGSLDLTGQPLSGTTMKLVLAGRLPDNDLLDILQGGVVGAEMELTKQ